MNTKEIISSGILELYATGLTTPEESRQVEAWVVAYPEVAAELDEIAASLEAYANVNAIQPSTSVKDKIFAMIDDSNISSNKTEHTLKAVPPLAPVKRIAPFWRSVAAAAILLLIGSAVLNIAYYNKYNASQDNLVAARQSLGVMEEKTRELTEQTNNLQSDMQVVQSKYSVPVALNGLEASPESAAKIFWMKNSGDVFIDPSNLPDAPSGKQYQLWAIIDGKPVDGGMILKTDKGRYHIQKMKSLGGATIQAFAITLEKENGSPSPEGPMFVMGKM